MKTPSDFHLEVREQHGRAASYRATGLAHSTPNLALQSLMLFSWFPAPDPAESHLCLQEQSFGIGTMDMCQLCLNLNWSSATLRESTAQALVREVVGAVLDLPTSIASPPLDAKELARLPLERLGQRFCIFQVNSSMTCRCHYMQAISLARASDLPGTSKVRV